MLPPTLAALRSAAIRAAASRPARSQSRTIDTYGPANTRAHFGLPSVISGHDHRGQPARAGGSCPAAPLQAKPMWTIPCGGVGDQPHPTGAFRLARAGSSIPPARARRPKLLASSGQPFCRYSGRYSSAMSTHGVQRALHNSARRVTVTRKRSPASSDEVQMLPIRLTVLGGCRDMSRYQFLSTFSIHRTTEKSANSELKFSSRLAETLITY